MFFCLFFVYTMEVRGLHCLIPNILQNNLLVCLLQKKESHAGLKQHKG